MNMPRIFLTMLAFVALLLPMGCTSKTSDDEAMAPADIKEQPFFARVYRHVQIPPGFEFIDKKSNFADTKSFRGGVLRFEGRREINSVAEFFKNNMPKHQWDRVYMDTGERMLQAYIKDNKTCMIQIYESTLTTVVEIFVTDTAPEGSLAMDQ